MASLQSLICEGCNLTGALPAWQYMALQHLTLPHNSITGDGKGLPPTWARMPQLAVVDLSFNRISGQPDDDYFGFMPALRELHLQGNRLRGSIRAGAPACLLPACSHHLKCVMQPTCR
jgi:hypothetical protein